MASQPVVSLADPADGRVLARDESSISIAPCSAASPGAQNEGEEEVQEPDDGEEDDDDEEGLEPIHIAARRGDLDALKEQLDEKMVDVDEEGTQGTSRGQRSGAGTIMVGIMTDTTSFHAIYS